VPPPPQSAVQRRSKFPRNNDGANGPPRMQKGRDREPLLLPITTTVPFIHTASGKGMKDSNLGGADELVELGRRRLVVAPPLLLGVVVAEAPEPPQRRLHPLRAD
jgi:hypothetical protein